MPASHDPVVYEIRVAGHLDDGHWSEWFDGLAMMPDEHGNIVIVGPIPDQAALYGLLARVRDLGLPLLSVNLMESHRRDERPS